MRLYWLAWSTLTWLSAMLSTAGCLLPYWLKGTLYVDEAFYSDLGLYRRCVYPIYRGDGSILVDTNCGHYQFMHLPHSLWKAALLLLSMTCCTLFFLTFFLFFIGFCMDLLREKSVVRACQVIQTVAGCFGLAACFLYPLGWSDNWEVQQICGEESGRFTPGRCHLGWAFVLTCAGCVMSLLTTSLPIMLAYRLGQGMYGNKILDSGACWSYLSPSSSDGTRQNASRETVHRGSFMLPMNTNRLSMNTTDLRSLHSGASLHGSQTNFMNLSSSQTLLKANVPPHRAKVWNGGGGTRVMTDLGRMQMSLIQNGDTDTIRSSLCFPSNATDMESSVHTLTMPLLPPSLQGSRVFLIPTTQQQSAAPLPMTSSNFTQRRFLQIPSSIGVDSSSVCSMSPYMTHQVRGRQPIFTGSPLPETPLCNDESMIGYWQQQDSNSSIPQPPPRPQNQTTIRRGSGNTRYSYISYQSLPLQPDGVDPDC